MILSPQPDEHVKGRVVVEGTAKPGLLIVINTDVLDPEDGSIIKKDIPGTRVTADQNGRFRAVIACPRLMSDSGQPLHYVIKVYAMDDQNCKSDVVSVRVVSEPASAANLQAPRDGNGPKSG